MLPTDKRLLSLDPFKSLWLYMNIKKQQIAKKKERASDIRMICTFINPDIAKKVFKEEEVHESEGFEEDLKKLAPGVDLDKFRAVLGD